MKIQFKPFVKPERNIFISCPVLNDHSPLGLSKAGFPTGIWAVF